MKSDIVYLRHIMDSILKIESYAAVEKYSITGGYNLLVAHASNL